MKPFSRLGLGTLHMGSLLDKEASKKLILRAIDFGVTYFDTAPLYGGTRAEEILGEALAETEKEVVVCTKVGLQTAKRKDGRFGVEVYPLNESQIERSVDASLRRLKRESIQLLMLHAFDPTTPLEETVEGLRKLYKKGKIQSFGCSNYNPAQLKLLHKHSPSDGPPFLAAQCHYNLIERRAEKSFIPFCEKKGIWVVVNRALARGALSGQYSARESFPEKSRAALSPRIRQWLTPEKLKVFDALSEIAKKRETPLFKISLQWLLKKHSQSVVLIGVRDSDQLDSSIQTLSETIDPTIFEKIDKFLNQELDVYKSPPRYFEK